MAFGRRGLQKLHRVCEQLYDTAHAGVEQGMHTVSRVCTMMFDMRGPTGFHSTSLSMSSTISSESGDL